MFFSILYISEKKGFCKASCHGFFTFFKNPFFRKAFGIFSVNGNAFKKFFSAFKNHFLAHKINKENGDFLSVKFFVPTDNICFCRRNIFVRNGGF